MSGALTGHAALPGAPVTPVADRAAPRMKDTALIPEPNAVRLSGWLGKRVARSEANRLLKVEEAPILAGFRHRPGEQAWIGEHVGKFLHAATLAWVYTGDPRLKEKLDRVATELMKTQEPDGYLGTYVPEQRFGQYSGADWDVWVHKYNLMGLLTYYRYTHNAAALDTCRRMGNLLLKTFGPGKKSILSAGTHMGMAATSVLEPMVLLYRATGDPRYLAFAKYLVRAWDEPNGPKVAASLLAGKSVAETANGKAYEMMSNLVGLCELARATGDRAYLQPVVNAWKDITAHELYLTGTASYGEHFHPGYDLPNAPRYNVGETCVTVTWIQLNAQLFRLTGQARFGNELERSFYNHLAAAQRPDGAEWCYYTALEGQKPYGPGINCCVSSGPRGMALLPQLAYLVERKNGQDTLLLNLFEPSEATLTLGGQRVTVKQTTAFPAKGGTVLTFTSARPATFAVKVRQPDWMRGGLTLDSSGGVTVHSEKVGWASYFARAWKRGDRLTAIFDIPLRLIPGDHGNLGRDALAWGPLILAYDTAQNPGLPPPAAIALAGTKGRVTQPLTGDSPLAVEMKVRSAGRPEGVPARFIPFAEAGASGSTYRVWLPSPDAELPQTGSLFQGGTEAVSWRGNVTGSISDGDPSTLTVTFNNTLQGEAWFEVSGPQPQTVGQVVFAHGQNFHDGGWFDTSAGKPQVQVKRSATGNWETVATLDTYPATTATDAGGLTEGELFTARLPQPVKAVAVRVIGTPASGDNPSQSFASCAELQAFPK